MAEVTEKDYIDFEQGEEPPVVPIRNSIRPPIQNINPNNYLAPEGRHRHQGEQKGRICSRSRSPPPYARRHHAHEAFSSSRSSRHYNQNYSQRPQTTPYSLPSPSSTYRGGNVLFFSLKSEVYSIIAQAKCNGNWPARYAVADRILGAAAHASRVYLLLSMETTGYFMAAALVDLPRAKRNDSAPGEKYFMIPLRIVELADVPFGMVRVPEEYMHDRGTMRDGIELDPAFGYEVLEAMKHLSIRLY